MAEIVKQLNALPNSITLLSIIISISGFIIVGFAKETIKEEEVNKKQYKDIISNIFNKMRYKNMPVMYAVQSVVNNSNYNLLSDEFKYCIAKNSSISLEAIIVLDYIHYNKNKVQRHHKFINFLDYYVDATVYTLTSILTLGLSLLLSLYIFMGLITFFYPSNVDGSNVIAVMVLVIISFSVPLVLLFFLSVGIGKFKNQVKDIDKIKDNIKQYEDKYSDYKNKGFSLNI